jgi:hypothetical protein
VNVIYLEAGAGFVFDQPNYNQLADDLLGIFAGPGNLSLVLANADTEVRIYDMADAIPRPVKAQRTKSFVPSGPSGPREVACCLSYYSGRNLPSQRGRIYVGPFTQSEMAMRPPAGLRTEVKDLGTYLSELGGVNVDWVQYSQKLNRALKVSNTWVDDEWDTQRRRGLKASTRQVATVSG